MNILFCPKNQKKVLQKEVKAFEAYLLTEETFLDSPDGLLIMSCARSYAWFLIFCTVFPTVLNKLSKIVDLSKVTRKERKGSILACPKLAK